MIIGGGAVCAHKSGSDDKPANNTVDAMVRGRVRKLLI
jgi:hypothetical protein